MSQLSTYCLASLVNGLFFLDLRINSSNNMLIPTNSNIATMLATVELMAIIVSGDPGSKVGEEPMVIVDTIEIE